MDKNKASKIHFRKESSGFYNTLKTRVDQYLYPCNLSRSYAPAILTFILLGSYSVLFVFIFTLDNLAGILISYMLLGALTTGIFLNIIHDAAHNALFRRTSFNKIAF